VTKIKQQCGTELVKKKSIQPDNNEATILEIASLKLLNNQYVVPLCGFDIEWGKSTLYLPLGHGTLLERVKNKTFNQNYLTKYMIQMTTGLQSCHHHDMIHRDMKPHNIVYIENEDAYKLIDFGLTVPYASTRAGLIPWSAATLWWRAPEALLDDAHYNYKIDVWALGVIFYFMVTSTNIFEGNSEIDMLHKIFKIFGTPNDVTWPGVTNLPEWSNKFPPWVDNKQFFIPKNQYYDVIIACLTLDPNKRATTDEVLVMLNQL
jgi:serine/threonine protein kinase